MYHSSETEGSDFNEVPADVFKGPWGMRRAHTVLEFEGNLDNWLEEMYNTHFDWYGMVGWLFKAENKKKFYCFEAAWKALQEADIVGEQPDFLTGCVIEKAFQTHD